MGRNCRFLSFIMVGFSSSSLSLMYEDQTTYMGIKPWLPLCYMLIVDNLTYLHFYGSNRHVLLLSIILLIKLLLSTGGDQTTLVVIQPWYPLYHVVIIDDLHYIHVFNNYQVGQSFSYTSLRRVWIHGWSSHNHCFEYSSKRMQSFLTLGFIVILKVFYRQMI